MKRLAAPLLLFVASLAVVPNGHGQQVANAAYNQQRHTNAEATVKDEPSAAPNQGKAAENKQPADHQYAISVKEMPPKDAWDKVYVILTALLVGVAIATLIAVWRQAIETRKAAQAARDSIRLQELAFTGWVTLDNWAASDPQISDTDGGFTTISFDVSNPTSFPVTITAVLILVLDDGYVGVQTPFRLHPNGRYKRSINVAMPSAKRSSFGGIDVNPSIHIVNVFVDYTDVLGRPDNQQFCVECSIESAVKASFNLFSTSLPEPQFWKEQKEGQNPN